MATRIRTVQEESGQQGRPAHLVVEDVMHGWAADRPTVEIAHLRKTYGPLLGPNGAGRTTTVECAIRLRSPDSGTIRLLGLDPRAEQDQVHEIR